MKLEEGMYVSGYATKTDLGNGEVIYYGPFTTLEQAEEWKAQLVPNTIVVPIYHPQHNRG